MCLIHKVALSSKQKFPKNKEYKWEEKWDCRKPESGTVDYGCVSYSVMCHTGHRVAASPSLLSFILTDSQTPVSCFRGDFTYKEDLPRCLFNVNIFSLIQTFTDDLDFQYWFSSLFCSEFTVTFS